MLQAVLNIQTDAIRQLADKVHQLTGHTTQVEFDDERSDYKVTLKAIKPLKTWIFRGTLQECYSYLVGWRHSHAMNEW